MIKLEHVVLPSPEQMEFVIEGMRNPMNSWGKSDSGAKYDERYDINFTLGENDLSLMQKLSNNGPVHSKFMRMMPVMVRITAPLYWWKEFDTYKIGTVANSCSTMHKIAEKEFTLDDFSCEHLDNDIAGCNCSDLYLDLILMLNGLREGYLEEGDKDIWWQMIQLLPSSYNQTRNVMLDYEVLKNIYTWRKDHKLDEWGVFCKWIETLPYSELITGGIS